MCTTLLGESDFSKLELYFPIWCYQGCAWPFNYVQVNECAFRVKTGMRINDKPPNAACICTLQPRIAHLETLFVLQNA
jgi:hypothetical protein